MLDKDVIFIENSIGNFFYCLCIGYILDKILKLCGINNDIFLYILVCYFFII